MRAKRGKPLRRSFLWVGANEGESVAEALAVLAANNPARHKDT